MVATGTFLITAQVDNFWKLFPPFVVDDPKTAGRTGAARMQNSYVTQYLKGGKNADFDDLLPHFPYVRGDLVRLDFYRLKSKFQELSNKKIIH